MIDRQELSELLPLLLRERDYIEINAVVRKMIESVVDYAQLCHMECERGTVNWKSESLPDCKLGNVRLWNKLDWEITNNVRAKTREASEREREAREAAREKHTAMRESLIAYFGNMGIPREVVTANMIKDFDSEQLSAMIVGLKQANTTAKL